MNILIINCSPVRNGATAEIVNLVKEHVEEGNVVKSVCIDDYDIKLCKGCRKCHETAKCFQEDDVDKLMVTYDWADKIVSVSPSYWADIPGQFKVFIDRCTPWCNTHQPHAKIKSGKKGYTIALRTGPSMPEYKEKVVYSCLFTKREYNLSDIASSNEKIEEFYKDYGDGNVSNNWD